MNTKNRQNMSLIKPHYHVVPMLSVHLRWVAARRGRGVLSLMGMTVLHIGPECGADSYLECDCDLVAVRACILRSENCCECDPPSEWRH